MGIDQIKFGTDGWRAIIARDFTENNVARVAQGLANWLKKSHQNAKVVVGHDCRFGGQMFAEVTAKVLMDNGIHVDLAKGFVSTPMVSYGVLALGAQQGVVITASHNPPTYNGFKLKGAHGGPTSPKDIAAVEALIPDTIETPTSDLSTYETQGLLTYVDLEAMYIAYLQKQFDFEKLNNAPFKMAYDAMFGAGQNVIKKLMPSAVLLNCTHNPGFNGQAPEPLAKNLVGLGEVLAKTPEIKMGLATDGDADRIGLFDEEGQFVDAHHILLLLIHYLAHYKGLNGKVVVAYSATNRIQKMAEKYQLPYEVTPIGFKYISAIMVHDDVLVGGEESGGIAVKGHIPERDGIYDGLLIFNFMVETGKTLKQLIEEVYEIVGPFVYDRLDMHLDNSLKESIIQKAQNDGYTAFGDYTFDKVGKLDGVKYELSNGGWIMLRASGTEPLLRIYVEGNSAEEVTRIFEHIKQTIL